MKRTIFCIRHGETVVSGTGSRFCGALDPPLTEAGRAQAARTAELVRSLAKTPLDAATSEGWVSPSLRARETAEALGAKWRIVPELAEQDFGEWEGLEKSGVNTRWHDTFVRWLRDPVATVPPGGESGIDVLVRVDSVLRALRASPGSQIVLVSHKTLLRFLIARLIGIEPLRARYALDLGVGAVAVVDDDGTQGALRVLIAPP